jgi:superfamily II DNA or RNA helicase
MKKYGHLRKHQLMAAQIANAIGRGFEPRKTITANVTPGGGKTLMAAIFANELFEAGKIDRVCVVCPRDSLRAQVAQGFTCRERGLTRELALEKNGKLSQSNLFSPAGYVTTYQSIDASPQGHLKRQTKKRWLVVLDELHHLAESENARWRDAIEPLVRNAEYVLLMSGTLYRHDREKVPFIEYDEDGRALAQIAYTRADALREQAVLQLNITRYDGFVQYEHKAAEHSSALSNAAAKEQPRSLKTALLKPDYVDDLVMQSMHSWMAYRASVYSSRAIVVCHTQAEAKRVSRLIGSEFRQLEIALAISDERDASKVIKKFREKRFGDVLVTVGMAYEGLDVPDCTHLICLTDTRSTPWLDQCFARVTRFDSECRLSWEQQFAYVHVPDDARMCEYILNMEQEQLAITKEAGRVAVPVIRGASTFKPLTAELTDVAYGFENGFYSNEENALIQRLEQEHPYFKGAPHHERLKFARGIYQQEVKKTNTNGVSHSSVVA